MEELSKMQNEVDINILVSNYTQRIASLTNQNILLESKLQSLINDFTEEKNQFIEEIESLKVELARSKNKDK